MEAHRAAAEYYADQLATSPDALAGRTFLAERGFDRDAALTFTIGFAPRSGEALLRHLRGRGFIEDELVASGLAGRGQRGLYDRFRGRLLWPIRDLGGDVVGFGARRLFDDDRIEAKYLNTPETAIYKKSQVLYGVDLARKAIAQHRQLVVVEGYTDVMACHLAGVATAVATCGTAFGEEHIRIVRRLLGDDRSIGHGGQIGGQVVFTFDGDEAGRKAALKAFEEDQRFVAHTYIAVADDGMDPCELRQARGDESVRELIAAREPLFQFAIRSSIAQFDLDSAEGQVEALRTAAPLVARIRDVELRPVYARRLAGWLGMGIEPVLAAVRRAPAAGAGAEAIARTAPAARVSGTPRWRHNGARTRGTRWPWWSEGPCSACSRYRSGSRPRRRGCSVKRHSRCRPSAPSITPSWPPVGSGRRRRRPARSGLTEYSPRPPRWSGRWSPSWPCSRSQHSAMRRWAGSPPPACCAWPTSRWRGRSACCTAGCSDSTPVTRPRASCWPICRPPSGTGTACASGSAGDRTHGAVTHGSA